MSVICKTGNSDILGVRLVLYHNPISCQITYQWTFCIFVLSHFWWNKVVRYICIIHCNHMQQFFYRKWYSWRRPDCRSAPSRSRHLRQYVCVQGSSFGCLYTSEHSTHSNFSWPMCFVTADSCCDNAMS